MAEVFEAHSPLGASSAGRWMNCPGSYTLMQLLQVMGFPDSEEEDYRRDGIAAHEAAAYALQNNLEGWELVGQKYHEVEISPEIADAIQVYLSFCRTLPMGTHYIEQSVGATRAGTVNRKLYGTVDDAVVAGDTLYVTDYKHGEGILVPVDKNPQLMYYGVAFLLTMPDMENIKRVVLTIVQPRAYSEDGGIRSWETTADELLNWANDVLIPAMDVAEIEEGLTPGSWCRFCPAKLVCPVMTGMYGAAAKANPKHLPAFSNERLALEWHLREQVRFYLTALDKEVYRRLNMGQDVAGTKMVNKKASRVFKAGAEIELASLGPDIYDRPTLKSPAEIEKLGTEAKKLVRKLAYTPMTGYTVVDANDPKPAVKIATLKDTFGALDLDKLSK